MRIEYVNCLLGILKTTKLNNLLKTDKILNKKIYYTAERDKLGKVNPTISQERRVVIMKRGKKAENLASAVW